MTGNNTGTNIACTTAIQKGFEIAGITRYNEKAIMNIVNIAKKQSHGTTIIVSEEAHFESDRLAKANRTIKIAPIRVDEDTILSLSAIDGAMIIYTDGICYAIGAILDGVVAKTGNIARGARYNSAITYIDFGAPEKKAVAIIVSSDGHSRRLSRHELSKEVALVEWVNTT